MHEPPSNETKNKPGLPPYRWGLGVIEYGYALVLVTAVSVFALSVAGVRVADVFDQVVNALDRQPDNPGHVVVSMVDAGGRGIANTRVYAFNEGGLYTGRTGRTDSEGRLSFPDLADGAYKFRADYQSQLIWSDTIAWPHQWQATIDTGQRPITVRVLDHAGNGIAEVRVYAFNEKGWYTGVYGDTDRSGQLTLYLADGAWKFRADYQARDIWSEVVKSPGVTKAIVRTGQRPFTVNVADKTGQGIANARVYVYTERGWYTGVYGDTDSAGQLALNLADGGLKFRVDIDDQEHWSDIIHSPAATTTTLIAGN